jgi:hypothetical protein
MDSPLKKEFEYYVANQGGLVQQYDGKFIVIKDQAVIGVYADKIQAITETQKHHVLGTFLVQKVAPGSAEPTQAFHSRVSFSAVIA